MKPIDIRGRRARRARAAATVLALVAACLAIAACGSSSSSPATTSAAAGQGGPGAGRFAAIRQCLARNGINLPARPGNQDRGAPGATGPAGPNGATGPNGPTGPRGPGRGGFFFRGTGPRLPPGVTQQQFQAAAQKCGLTRFGPGGPGVNNPAFRQALTSFAACMRQNGVNLPPPNTTGNGPLFKTNGIDTNSPKFRAATAKCRLLLPRFGFRGGAAAGDQVQPGSTTGVPAPSTQ